MAPQDKLFGVGLGVDFPVALVDGLLARFQGQKPEDLARAHVIVNTERMGRRIKQILTQKGALLHPKIILLSDLFDLTGPLPFAAPQSPLINRFELISLVSKLLDQQKDFAARASLFDLSDSLASLIDEMQGEGVDPETIAQLNVSDQSGHWQRTQSFLGIVQSYLESRDTNPDKESFQRQKIAFLADKWVKNPISEPVFLAGSTGSRGTTLLLIQAIAQLDQGGIILPGMDWDMQQHLRSATAQHAMQEDHPQYRFIKVAEAIGADIADIRPWHAETPLHPDRNRLISLALRPAPVTDSWLREGPSLQNLDSATQDITWVEAPSKRSEAMSIALRLRKAAQDGVTAALITPDRQLTRQVAAALDRWDIVPDDSAGVPLQLTPPGRFLRQVCALIHRTVTSSTLLALLKHPLTHSGGARNEHLRLTRDLELWLRRKGIPYPTADILTIWAAKQKDPMAEDWTAWIVEHSAGIVRSGDHSLADLLAHHLTIAQGLANGCKPDADAVSGGLWKERAGIKTRDAIQRLQDAAPTAQKISARDYGDIFGGVLSQDTLRDRDAPYPGILIWGTLEARVQGADLVILGGLNEGSWPEPPTPDPWLNRKMRADAGLLLPERRIGLSAHDFQIAIAAKEVWITRSIRSDDAETVASRWINRLQNLLNGLDGQGGPKCFSDMIAKGNKWLAMADKLEEFAPVPPAPRPSPRPPLAARPKGLSVTEIKTLSRDPYAIYAKHVLGLKPLESIEKTPDAALKGTIIHATLENFVKQWDSVPPETRKQALLQENLTNLSADAPWAVTQIFWQSKLEKSADDFITAETERRQTAMPIGYEKDGERTLGALDFTLKGKADRIDQTSDGQLIIYDYKTGKIPTTAQQINFDKQLYLLAAIAEEGGFKDIDPAPVCNAEFLGVTSSDKDTKAPLDKESVSDVWAKFIHLIQKYHLVETGYTPRRAMFDIKDISNYDQLSRFGEWQITQAPEPEDLT